MKRILGRVWLGWAGFWFALFFVLLYPLFYIWLSTPVLYKIGHFQRRIWGILASITGLIFPIIKFESPLPKGRRRIYVANHSSYLDILTCGTYLPGFNFFMAKMELNKVPMFNIWFRSIDIPVQRDKRRSSYDAFINAGIQFDKGIDMIIFPEGRIPDHAPNMIKLKNGAFKLAIEKGALIVPVTLPDNFHRMNTNDWVGSPGRMRIHVHRPIDTANLKVEDADNLKDQVFSIIENKLFEYGTISKKHEDNE